MATKPTYAMIQHWDYRKGEFSRFYTVLQIHEQSPVRIVATPLGTHSSPVHATNFIRDMQEARDDVQA